MSNIVKKLRFTVPLTIFREGRSFVAYSPILDLSTCGKNFEEAKKNFFEAVEIFFEELNSKGTTDEVLGELGWEKEKNVWMPPTLIAQETEQMTVAV